jgi:hypothetical protein
MSTLYFSGVDRPEFAHILGRKKAAGMINRFDLKAKLIQECRRYSDGNWFCDSGAFTKPVLTTRDIQEYAELINVYSDIFRCFANCDEIGNQIQSNKNYDYLLSLLPDEHHKKVLWIFQYGSSLQYLEEALTQHQRIGIGGLVPLIRDDYERGTALILEIANFIASRNAHAVPHYFGIGGKDLIESLKRIHKNFSVDNSTWIQAAKNGECINAKGKRISTRELSAIFGVDFTVDECLAQNVSTMRQWVEGPITKRNNKKASLQMSLFVDEGSQNELTKNIA